MCVISGTCTFRIRWNNDLKDESLLVVRTLRYINVAFTLRGHVSFTHSCRPRPRLSHSPQGGSSSSLTHTDCMGASLLW